jgi:DNA repair protein RadC
LRGGRSFLVVPVIHREHKGFPRAPLPNPYDEEKRSTDYTFEIVRETAEEYQPTVGSPEVAAKLARRVIGCELSEVVIAMMLDSRHRVLGYTEVSRGTVNASRLTPRDVFLPALLSNAAAVVV